MQKSNLQIVLLQFYPSTIDQKSFTNEYLPYFLQKIRDKREGSHVTSLTLEHILATIYNHIFTEKCPNAMVDIIIGKLNCK